MSDWNPIETAPNDGGKSLVLGSIGTRGTQPMIAVAWRDEKNPDAWWTENNGAAEAIFPILWTRAYQHRLPLDTPADSDRPMTEWKSIDSAPRDGTKVLLYEGPSAADMATGYYQPDLTWWLDSVGDRRLLPKMWQPLPPPPTEETTR